MSVFTIVTFATMGSDRSSHLVEMNSDFYYEGYRYYYYPAYLYAREG